MLIKKPKGTKDILPEEVYKWKYIENAFSNLCSIFGYKQIRTPVFEYTELFQRGVGESTDIVQKEMYTFTDKGGRSITLRPEGTAGIVRSYIENGMDSYQKPIKLFYNVSAYRYENVQKGRYREFNQMGVEVFGAKSPDIDVEIIGMIQRFLDEIGIENVKLNINNIGCPKCREKYNQKLKEYVKPHLDKMCSDCQKRYEKNPLRIIDCKIESCKKITKNAPALLDYICDECSKHFEGVKSGLENIGVEYYVDKNIVRGLDYYTKTVFEFVSDNVGTQGTICAGGRYDDLIKQCGGPQTPGIGFAIGTERLLMEIENSKFTIPEDEPIDVFIASIGKKADLYAEKMVFELRNMGIRAEKDLMERSLKAQLKYAGKINCRYYLVFGENEISSKKAVIKNMITKNEKEIKIDIKLLVEEIKNGGC